MPDAVTFIHAPKCGGTSVGSALRARYIYSQATISLEESTAMRRLLWPEAELTWDDGDLLPSALVRKGEGRTAWLDQVRRLDLLLVSHADNDHAGGASTIINSPLASGSINYTPLNGCEHGKTVEWEQLRILFLWPKAGNQEDSNAQSCVVKITDGEQSVLIPGDIERSSEYALLTLLKQTNKHNSYKQDLEADLLIAPHHGSKTSSTNAFIRAVNPKAVVFTQGYLNRWRFPAKEVQERYRNKRVLQLKTSYHGYIQATFHFNNHSGVTNAKPDSFKLESYRKDLHKRWFIPAR